jgi:hypothetical protein
VPEERAVRGVEMIAAAGTLWLFYLLAREGGAGSPLALAGTAVFALSPLFLFMAVQPMSDALATLWAEATVLFAWRARRRPLDAAAAGAAFGIAVMVRPTSALLLAPVALALPHGRRAYAMFAAGALPAAAFLAAYQSAAYGHPLASGYGDMSSAFSIALIDTSLRHYLRWLPAIASWLVVLAPVGMFAWRGELAPWRTIAAAWVVALFGIYAMYPVTSETWWSLRFVLPAIPLLLVASLAGLQAIAGRAAPLVAVLAIPLLIRQPEFQAFRSVASDERAYREALQLLTLNPTTPRPVLMVQMSGAAMNYTPQLGLLRYDELTPEAWGAIAEWQRRERLPLGAALFPSEVPRVVDERSLPVPCTWSSRGRYRHISFWQCEPP